MNIQNLINTKPQNTIILVDGHLVHSHTDPNIDFSTNQNYISNLGKHTSQHQIAPTPTSILNIEIPNNVQIETPLSIICMGKVQSLNHETAIKIGKNSHLECIETFLSNNDSRINNVTTISENATFKSSTIHDLNANSVNTYNKYSQMLANSVSQTTNFMLHDGNITVNDVTDLFGFGAEVVVNTVAIANADQKQKITVKALHSAPHTKSKIVNHGIVKDKAHLTFDSIGEVHKGMRASDAQQDSRILNLSKTAEAIANPMLIIDEGDITASHAASIGQLDEEQLYYLMSRGMTNIDAKKLIVSGFLMPFIECMTNEFLKEQLFTIIEQKLAE